MTDSGDQQNIGKAAPEPAKLSRLVRRIHMFTGLFLAPWMLMYALSTLVMTHLDYVRSFYKTRNPAMVAENEMNYSRSFPTNTTREVIAVQILRDIGLDGTHYVSGGRDGKPLVINRQRAMRPQKITFDPAKGKIKIEHEEFRMQNFLERMHRRRGYNEYAIQNSWGFSVDFAVVTMVFWSLSGLWLWWEIKATQRWGTICLAGGWVLFGLFLALL